MGYEQKMFRINLSNIPLSERSKKVNALFGSKHTISEKDYLNLSLETTWRINGAGDEIPTFHIIMETDHNEKKKMSRSSHIWSIRRILFVKISCAFKYNR